MLNKNIEVPRNKPTNLHIFSNSKYTFLKLYNFDAFREILNRYRDYISNKNNTDLRLF